MGWEMGKERSFTWGLVFQELFQFGVYKRNQGRVARQVTCAAVWVAVCLGAWRLWLALPGDSATRYLVAGVVALVGIWLGYRLVNIPQFADFLIAVEAEMTKVSWPSGGELIRSSLVVIIVIFLLAAILFAYDLIWQTVFKWIGVRP
jgi:preprotein translocase subunit SecE